MRKPLAGMPAARGFHFFQPMLLKSKKVITFAVYI